MDDLKAQSVVEGASFATDLLDGYPAVLKRHLTSAKLNEEFSRMVKERCRLEEEYAKGLDRLAGTVLPGTANYQDGTLVEASANHHDQGPVQ